MVQSSALIRVGIIACNIHGHYSHYFCADLLLTYSASILAVVLSIMICGQNHRVQQKTGKPVASSVLEQFLSISWQPVCILHVLKKREFTSRSVHDDLVEGGDDDTIEQL